MCFLNIFVYASIYADRYQLSYHFTLSKTIWTTLRQHKIYNFFSVQPKLFYNRYKFRVRCQISKFLGFSLVIIQPNSSFPSSHSVYRHGSMRCLSRPCGLTPVSFDREDEILHLKSIPVHLLHIYSNRSVFSSIHPFSNIIVEIVS